jgi:hypothetical protein
MEAVAGFGSLIKSFNTSFPLIITLSSITAMSEALSTLFGAI